MTTTIDWEQELDAWEAKYQPLKNHLNDDGFWENDKFETYGKELDFVVDVILNGDPRHVWTLVEGDDGNLYIVNGYHLVNRVNYFVTNLPFEGEFLEVPYYIFDEEEDEDDND
jgi:hypothetical protein